MPAVPTWDQYMAPSLQVLSDGEVHRTRPIATAAANLLGVTEDQRAILIPSGGEQWANRGNWALSYLARVGAVERPSRGRYRITDVGRKLLGDHPDGITEKDLRALSGDPNAPHTWKAFPTQPKGPGTQPVDPGGESSELEPEEQIEAGVARSDADVADQLMKRILDQEPAFFERAVLDLLIAMGFGGTDGSATPTQLSRDGGIDGIVDQDALGLSRIYVQAKRYAIDNVIGRPSIQGFVGALAGNQANQGVFITTSRFSPDARAYAGQVPARIVLIDGSKLTRLMIRFGVGVQVKRTVTLVEIDEDFFE